MHAMDPLDPVWCGNASASPRTPENVLNSGFLPVLAEGRRMNPDPQFSAHPLIAKVQWFFSQDLALENYYLRQINQILRSNL
jgi:hypothetical protein